MIILLHGGGLSWWNYRAVAEMLRHDYHVILPKMYHGEFSIHYVNDYVNWILQIVKHRFPKGIHVPLHEEEVGQGPHEFRMEVRIVGASKKRNNP